MANDDRGTVRAAIEKVGGPSKNRIPALFKTLGWPAEGARGYVLRKGLEKIMSEERKASRAILQRPTPVTKLSKVSLAALNDTVSILEGWRLSSGTTLGHATRADLTKEIIRSKSVEEGMGKRRTFLETIRKKLPKGGKGTVSTAFAEHEVQAIRDRVWG